MIWNMIWFVFSHGIWELTCKSPLLAKRNWVHFSNRHKSSMLKEKNNSQMVVWWWLTMVQNQKSLYCQKKWYFLCFPGCIICIIQHGTWEYTPGISENHLNQTIIFRFEPLVFGAKNPSVFRSVSFLTTNNNQGIVGCTATNVPPWEIPV